MKIPTAMKPMPLEVMSAVGEVESMGYKEETTATDVGTTSGWDIMRTRATRAARMCQNISVRQLMKPVPRVEFQKPFVVCASAKVGTETNLQLLLTSKCIMYPIITGIIIMKIIRAAMLRVHFTQTCDSFCLSRSVVD